MYKRKGKYFIAIDIGYCWKLLGNEDSQFNVHICAKFKYLKYAKI